jgi:hypothetical protein
MDARNNAEKLLATLIAGDRSPAETVFDDDNSLYLDFDGIPFVFTYSEDSEELVSQALLGTLPAADRRRRQTLRELMEGNFCWSATAGGILGLDEENGLIGLAYRFDPLRENPVSFQETMNRQLALAEYWQKRLAAAHEDASTAAGGSPMMLAYGA